MSDSQTITIPAAEHAATAETRSARLLTALAQNPEPLSTPDLASLPAEPGQRQRLLHRHEQAGHVEQAGHATNGPGRPAIIWRITTAGRGSTTTTRHQLSRRPLPPKHNARPNRLSARRPNGTVHWTKRAQLSTSRLRGSAANAPLTS